MSILSERLILLRKEKNFNQMDVAKHLNIGRTTYTGYENGTSLPNIEMLEQLSSFFGVTTDYLLGKTDLKLDINQLSLLKEIDLNNEELFKKYSLTIDGEPLSREQFIKAIELVRVMSK